MIRYFALTDEDVTTLDNLLTEELAATKIELERTEVPNLKDALRRRVGQMEHLLSVLRQAEQEEPGDANEPPSI
jgi:hypothetical protein